MRSRGVSGTPLSGADTGPLDLDSLASLCARSSPSLTQNIGGLGTCASYGRTSLASQSSPQGWNLQEETAGLPR
jgi:hypothetical protein